MLAYIYERVDAVGEPLHLHNVRFDTTSAGIGVNDERASAGNGSEDNEMELIIMSKREVLSAGKYSL